MLKVRRAETLGQVTDGEAHLHCHFAFGAYNDPAHMHNGRLRVVNQISLPAQAQYVAGPEKNVDIVTWVTQGSVTTQCEHFHAETINKGDIQVLCTATGCTGLSWKAGAEAAQLLQFWFLPDCKGGIPMQEIRNTSGYPDTTGFRIIASGFPDDDPEEEETIRDGAPAALLGSGRLLHTTLSAGEGARYQTTPGRSLFLLVVSGTVTLEDTTLDAGDSAAISEQQELLIIAQSDASVLLADTAYDAS
ncbi:pirin family protein [Acetobacter sp. DsW_059]|uniref:pirin family protein n=1 Tax=Acetobacter sp. DsW_059 TaxID=1670661 RepID=UPI000A38817C|nr:pirin family protein [Acetobacter sp. DsW_059]OUJ10278.1 hypothetical protein HK25_07185 [Acetobacter sp. DsW_059]